MRLGSYLKAGEESAYRVIQVVGRIQSLTVVGLRSPFPPGCCLGITQLLEVALRAWPVVPPLSNGELPFHLIPVTF